MIRARCGRTPGLPPRTVVVTGLVLAGALVLSACGSTGKAWGPGSGTTALSARAPVLSVAGESIEASPTTSSDGAGTTTTTRVAYDEPVTLTLSDGSFTSVALTSDEGDTLSGSVSEDGTSWVSRQTPRPDRVYQGAAQVADSRGATRMITVSFSVTAVPSDRRISFTVTPQDGSTVGIGQPIRVRFSTAIDQENRAAMEEAMTVVADTPSGSAVTGRWHWLNGSEVHWRPKEFWESGTTVSLSMQIAGLKASDGIYGRKDYRQSFTIGSSRIAKVDGQSHRILIYQDGELVHDWPTGTGKAGLETYSGTYVVLGKYAELVMDSCSAGITCDKESPEYYSAPEYWATRVTASGTFLHAAGWDPQIGRANVSHGCIHLTDANAKTYYDNTVIGDVVIVSNTGRGPEERIATQDPGLYDWNLSWADWVAGSALS
jgi:lipoprotein-anchoring transpeptidase ErfK/SrfK